MPSIILHTTDEKYFILILQNQVELNLFHVVLNKTRKNSNS